MLECGAAMNSAFLLDSSERRARFNPCVTHALAILDDCQGDVSEARKLADLQLQCCADQEFSHWLEVYAVLVGERGGQS